MIKYILKDFFKSLWESKYTTIIYFSIGWPLSWFIITNIPHKYNNNIVMFLYNLIWFNIAMLACGGLYNIITSIKEIYFD